MVHGGKTPKLEADAGHDEREYPHVPNHGTTSKLGGTVEAELFPNKVTPSGRTFVAIRSRTHNKMPKCTWTTKVFARFARFNSITRRRTTTSTTTPYRTSRSRTSRSRTSRSRTSRSRTSRSRNSSSTTRSSRTSSCRNSGSRNSGSRNSGSRNSTSNGDTALTVHGGETPKLEADADHDEREYPHVPNPGTTSKLGGTVEAENTDEHEQEPELFDPTQRGFITGADNCVFYEEPELFDPTQRGFITGANNCAFYENFDARKDALRNFDRRRLIARKGHQQPMLINDNAWSSYDAVSSEGVRQLYDLYENDPESIDPEPIDVSNDVAQQRQSPEERVREILTRPHLDEHEHEPAFSSHQLPSKSVDSEVGGDTDNENDDAEADGSKVADEENEVEVLPEHLDEGAARAARNDRLAARSDSTKQKHKQEQQKPGRRAQLRGAVKKARSILDQAIKQRPVRLVVTGKEVKLTPEDRAFIDFAIDADIPVKYLRPNPKQYGSKSYGRYQRYMLAGSMAEAIDMGSSRADVCHDYSKGFILFPKHESTQPGHVVHGAALARAVNETTLHEDMGFNNDSKLLWEAYATMQQLKEELQVPERARPYSESLRATFQQQLEGAYDVVFEAIMPVFEDERRKQRLARGCVRKLLISDLKNHASVNLLNVADVSDEPDYKSSLRENGCADWKKWEDARREELDAMDRFKVFEIVKRSTMRPGTKPLTAKWVHRVKTDEFNRRVRWKARLVCRGFLQREYDTFHPDETYAPVVSHDALRLLLASATLKGLTLYQADVANFYLQTDLLFAAQKDVYMEPPPGVDIGRENIYLVKRPLYGSRQGAHDAAFALADHLVNKLGFSRCESEPSLYRRVKNGNEIVVAAYCDDLTIACKDDRVRDGFLAEMRTRFHIKDDEGGRIRWLLGVRIRQSIEEGTVELSQKLAIEKIAETFLSKEELVKAELVQTPAKVEQLPKLEKKEVPDTQFHMLSALGSLIYVSGWTRPDVSVAVSTLCRHAATPGTEHIKAVKRVIQYLYRTRNDGLLYSNRGASATKPDMYAQGRHPLSTDQNHLDTFVDSDYAADISRRSMKGIVIKLANAPVSWTSTLNKTVSTSTAESEVMAAFQAAKDAIHLKNMMSFLGLPQQTINLKEDNTACMAQINGGLKYVRRAKHYMVHLHFLQRQVLDKVVKFEYCASKAQLADAFTKNLPAGDEPGHFHYFAKQLVQPVFSSPEDIADLRGDGAND